ncbi:MAG: C45 family peptidase [Polyangiaceae bacterium]|jgi:hypothetical protein|nr:C45 family peptidase [Polyangiaceae bacterium]
MRPARAAAVIPRGLAFALLGIATLHVALQLLTAIPSPALPSSVRAAPRLVVDSDGTRRVGRSWARRHRGIHQVLLDGDAAQIGHAHSTLLHDEMVATERAVWELSRRLIPVRAARVLLMDLSRVRYRNLDSSLGYARRAELAAQARAFAPDPFANELPTYHRLVFLNALYDMSLSFEHSPLIGCSSVVFDTTRTRDGHALLARNFDFEVHEVFDRRKAVVLFRENGKLPVLSVAWPGLSGLVTGINSVGVAAVVHGARAGTPSAKGEPVLVTMREALAHALTLDAAVAWIRARDPMVSHMIMLADAHGRGAVIERVPGLAAFVRYAPGSFALSNHLEGPSASDPANQRVRAITSTLARRARMDELLGTLTRDVTPGDAIGLLRDRRAVGGEKLPDGDRQAIDADIATHGVVMDLTARRIWVSEGPHLQGVFVGFDLQRWLASPQQPAAGAL